MRFVSILCSLIFLCLTGPLASAATPYQVPQNLNTMSSEELRTELTKAVQKSLRLDDDCDSHNDNDSHCRGPIISCGACSEVPPYGCYHSQNCTVVNCDGSTSTFSQSCNC